MSEPEEKRYRVSGTLRVEFDFEVDATSEAKAREYVESHPVRVLDGAMFEEVDFDEVFEVEA